MPTSLVTGGAGFIGSHVADELLKRGHRVVVVDDLSGGSLGNLSSAADYTFVPVDITKSEQVNDVFAGFKPDYVFHLAAYAAEGLSHFIRRFNYTNNVVGSANLVNAAVNHGCKCFVFTSSIAVYGAGQAPFDEATPPAPDDPYGIAKLAVEMDLRAAHRMWRLPYVIFRPHNVYGERQNIGDRYRNVVGIFMNQCLCGEPMTIFGDGTQQRAFTHVSDVAPIIAASAETPAAHEQTFNIGADMPYSVNALSACVAAVMDVPLRRTYLPAREEAHAAFSSHKRLERVFERQAPMLLGTGLAQMAAWVRQHGARSTPAFNGIEVREKLPPSWCV